MLVSVADVNDFDGIVTGWTLADKERGLVAGKRGSTRLGFALMLKFFVTHCRFPVNADDFTVEVVGFVARQVGVDPAEFTGYAWSLDVIGAKLSTRSVAGSYDNAMPNHRMLSAKNAVKAP